MSEKVTSRESDKFMLRLPDGMRDSLKAEAETNKRSMNAEIVARLEESLSRNEDEARQRASETADQIVQMLIERMAAMRLDMERRIEALEAEKQKPSPSPKGAK